MYDIRLFFLALSIISAAALVFSLIASAQHPYQPKPIRPAYGDTSWSRIDELEEL